MAFGLVNIGTTPNDGTGDALRNACAIINDSLTYLKNTMEAFNFVEEADIDGLYYVRSDAAWENLRISLCYDANITSPSNGQALVYNSTTSKWTPATIVNEAPNDGEPYIRQDSAWEYQQIQNAQDVDKTYAQEDGDILKWSAAKNKYEHTNINDYAAKRGSALIEGDGTTTEWEVTPTAGGQFAEHPIAMLYSLITAKKESIALGNGLAAWIEKSSATGKFKVVFKVAPSNGEDFLLVYTY